jgi:hypothetical protein
VTFVPRRIWICLCVGAGLACGHVEPNPPPDAAKPNIVVDAAFFETHPESGAAWILYAMQPIETPDAGDYRIEVDGRRKMVGYWKESGAAGTDEYLDFLVRVEELGFLEEYVIAAFGRPGWTVHGPAMADLDIPSFATWAGENLQGHTAEIRAHLERPRLEGPGADYPPPEAFVDARGPRCDMKDELEAVLERWETDRRALSGRALAARSGSGFLDYLDKIGTGGELSRTGATWVPQSVVDLLFIGGFCAIERTELRSAQRYLEAASSLDPNNVSIRMELAHVWIQRREFTPAEEQIAFVLATSRDPCEIAQALRKRGYIEFERGQLIEAYATYTQSLDHEPGSELARRELGLLYATMEAQGFEELPPPEYVPPPSEQLTTRCTL